MNQVRETASLSHASVNYIFYGFYFAIVACIHVMHVFLIEPQITFSTLFFAVYALAQVFLETLFLMVVGVLIQRYLSKLMNLYVLFVFFMFLSHVIDFPLIRLVDMTFWYALSFVTQESYENFIELLLASNISFFVWLLAGFGGIALMMSGLFLFRMTERLSCRKKIVVSIPLVCAFCCTAACFLLSWDYGVKGHISKIYADRYLKTLPWKSTFFPQRTEYVSLKNSMKEIPDVEGMYKQLDSQVFSLARKPDIYLFVVESLREDFIVPEITPHLAQFKEDHVSFPLSLSNANATHISWFSLFHSQFPFYWEKMHPAEKKEGSFPLSLLKKMGYKIYVSSSARLVYYQMDRIIFGEGAHLADSMFVPNEEINEPYMRDIKAMENLSLEMEKEGSGRLFIVFLDATHFDYSWPQQMTKFFPYEDKINYFKVAMSRDGVDEIKNRYRNALHFVDSLFGNFFEKLNATRGGEEAVVVITGDHGEEFYEHGNLFHCSSLSHPQMHIPIYYRFGKTSSVKKEARCDMTCHMDVFPTLFHYLVGEDHMGEILQGESIFKENRWPYTVVGRFNGSRTPSEFCIHNGDYKLVAEFVDGPEILKSRGFKVLSTKNCQDEILTKEIGILHEDFAPAFEKIFAE